MTLPGRPSTSTTARRVATPTRSRPTATGLWSATVDLRRGRNQFDVNAIDPETGKHSEDTVRLYITVPFPTVEAPTLSLDQPAEGATFENGAIPVQGMTTNATSVVDHRGLQRAGRRRPRPGKPTPAPPEGAGPAAGADRRRRDASPRRSS